MGYGGIDEIEIDDDYGYFYVHREEGYWNRYSIDEDASFLQWGKDHESDGIAISHLGEYKSEKEEYAWESWEYQS